MRFWCWDTHAAVVNHASLFDGCSMVGYLSSSGALLGLNAVFLLLCMIELFDIAVVVAYFV